MLIHDLWEEIKWKTKGDLKSPVKKLSWSFRVSPKLHGNPDITDILYLSLGRNPELRVLSITFSHGQRKVRSALA